MWRDDKFVARSKDPWKAPKENPRRIVARVSSFVRTFVNSSFRYSTAIDFICHVSDSRREFLTEISFETILDDNDKRDMLDRVNYTFCEFIY